MRGTLVSPDLVLSVVGIIPACAGNTGCREPCASRAGDHPRVCGEHLDTLGLSDLSEGSSPRVRGTRYRVVADGLPAGIIPACAGNTHLQRRLSPLSWDHPRVCGEHHIVLDDEVAGKGSSPRVRGTLLSRQRACIPPGIIPACAGNTTLRVVVDAQPRDHPRVCGEHPLASS